MTALIPYLAIAVGLLVIAIVFFVGLERSGRAHVAVVLLFFALLADSALTANQQEVVAQHLFHIDLGGFSLRLPELLIAAALGARLWVRGAPTRIGTVSTLWLVLMVWLLGGAVMGVLRGHDVNEVLFQGKAIIYVGGTFALAAGVDPRKLVSCFGTIFVATTALALGMITMTTVEQPIEVPIPFLGSDSAGMLGGDPATMFAVVASVGLVFVVWQRPRLSAYLAVGVLIVAVLISDQRAAILGLAVSMVLLAGTLATKTARRRFRIAPINSLLAATAVAALLLLVAVGGSVASGETPEAPLSTEFADTFFRQGKAQSAQDRINQWNVVSDLISEEPILGWGLGKTFSYYRPGVFEFETVAVTHNIGSDLLLRTGVVGVVLVIVALLASVREGVHVWRYSRDQMLAVLALGLTVAIAGLVAKGMVESLFEKYRLATLLGLSLGLLRAAATSSRDSLAISVTATHHEEDRVWN